jgi:hypothetical protein
VQGERIKEERGLKLRGWEAVRFENLSDGINRIVRIQERI